MKTGHNDQRPSSEVQRYYRMCAWYCQHTRAWQQHSNERSRLAMIWQVNKWWKHMRQPLEKDPTQNGYPAPFICSVATTTLNSREPPRFTTGGRRGRFQLIGCIYCEHRKCSVWAHVKHIKLYDTARTHVQQHVTSPRSRSSEEVDALPHDTGLFMWHEQPDQSIL